jgi:hypothetical protein
MKCIKAIKENKNKIGDIVRIGDVEADEKVRTGYWEYVSKSKWKEFLKPKEEDVKISNEIEKPLKKNHKTKESDKKTKNLKKK